MARDDLVHLHLSLVEHCARRFRNRGEPYEDLVQVGTIGLIKAVDRFETDRGVEFSTYATPTVIGEIKRHFRDKGWAIRVPRRLQELRMQIGGATGELTQKLGRSPTPRELAEVIGCTVEEIMEGIESSHAYATLSLDASDDSDDGPPAMLAVLGIEDADIEHVEVPRVDQAAARGPRRAREADPAAALLQEHDPVADRRGDRRLPDARLAAADPHAGAAADLARGRLSRLAPQRSSPGSSSQDGGRRGVQQPGDDHQRHDGERHDGEHMVRQSRKFQASPSWISWAITTGPRAQRRTRHSDQAHQPSATRRARGRTPTS